MEIQENMKNKVEFRNVSKIYDTGDIYTAALDEVSFNIESNEFTIIVGQSGAGKTTILNLLGGMDKVSSGEIIVSGNKISEYSNKELTSYRRYDIGFVFQFYNLVGNLTALENVELATEISNSSISAKEALDAVGLSHRIDNFPSQLSGGEQQRVSIARAIAKNPSILLCDEPTGALDYKTGKSILKTLQNISLERKIPVIIVTHNLALVPMAHKIIKVKSGEIEDIVINDYIKSVDDIEW